MIDGKLQLKHAHAANKISEIYKTKRNINVTRFRDSKSAKVGKQCRDDSIKQFSIQPHPTYVHHYIKIFQCVSVCVIEVGCSGAGLD